LIASAYGNVYVAQVALGADNQQTIKAFAEAAAHPGPSLILAYSTCIAHGVDMTTGIAHQKEAVDSGYWPLYRYDPELSHAGEHPLQLDSRKPFIPLRQFADREARFSMLRRSRPAEADQLMELAQSDVNERRRLYEQLAGIERTSPDAGAVGAAPPGDPQGAGAASQEDQ
jgi:pyruvate-ferredoxin/flavodoxin oxidoreductase